MKTFIARSVKRSIFVFMALITLAAGQSFAQRAMLPITVSGAVTASGRACSSCKLWTYVAGTTTPKQTFTTASGSTTNTNPVILNLSGRADVWFDSDTSMKFILEDSTCAYRDIYGTCHGSMIWTIDSLTDWGGSMAGGATTFTGDVTGNPTATVVEKLQGISVSTTDPTAEQALIYRGGSWTPGAVDLDATGSVSGILPSTYGGTGNGFAKFSGPTTSEKTFTLPNASATVLTTNASVTVAQGGTGLTSGTSGGVPAFTASGTITSSSALAANSLVVGGGAGAVPTTSPSSTVTTSKALVVAPAGALTVAGDGTIATDASLSNHFRVTLTSDCPCTLSTPTNPTDGQRVLWEVIQSSGGSETLDYSTAFIFGTVVTEPTITITADKRDFIEAVYNSTLTKWLVLYVTQGY